ncbi:helix-turn-helix transcriptional regulator [Rhodoglobus sp. NPDC076762]
MPTNANHSPITWQLRQVMAVAGMFHTTDLIDPLREQGVHLSREQIYRLVTKTPERLNVEILAALCRILDCTPNDLIDVAPVAAERAPRVVGEPRSNGPSIGTLRPIPAKLHRPTE